MFKGTNIKYNNKEEVKFDFEVKYRIFTLKSIILHDYSYRGTIVELIPIYKFGKWYPYYKVKIDKDNSIKLIKQNKLWR